MIRVWINTTRGLVVIVRGAIMGEGKSPDFPPFHRAGWLVHGSPSSGVSTADDDVRRPDLRREWL